MASCKDWIPRIQTAPSCDRKSPLSSKALHSLHRMQCPVPPSSFAVAFVLERMWQSVWFPRLVGSNSFSFSDWPLNYGITLSWVHAATHLISFHHIVQILLNHFDWGPSDFLWEGSTQRACKSLSTEVTCSSQQPKTCGAMVLSWAFWGGMLLAHVAAMKCPGSESFIHASAKATDGGHGWHQLRDV